MTIAITTITIALLALIFVIPSMCDIWLCGQNSMLLGDGADLCVDLRLHNYQIGAVSN